MSRQHFSVFHQCVEIVFIGRMHLSPRRLSLMYVLSRRFSVVNDSLFIIAPIVYGPCFDMHYIEDLSWVFMFY